MSFIINWLVAVLAVYIADYLLPGIWVDGFFAALVTALILGLLNAFVKPVLIILTLPVNIVTLGLFTFVINAVMVMLAAWIVPGFVVANFWQALLFSLALSIINYALSFIGREAKSQA